MWRADLLEKILMLGKIEGRRRRVRQRVTWDGWMASLTQWSRVWANRYPGDSEGPKAWRAAVHSLQSIGQELVTEQQQHKETQTVLISYSSIIFLKSVQIFLSSKNNNSKIINSIINIMVFPCANEGDIRDVGSIPGWGRSSGGGHGNPLQYSCLENPMDRWV